MWILVTPAIFIIALLASIVFFNRQAARGSARSYPLGKHNSVAAFQASAVVSELERGRDESDFVREQILRGLWDSGMLDDFSPSQLTAANYLAILANARNLAGPYSPGSP